ncbi:hypothetical protein CIY_00890 [Butyrivibrio fibrisolvens 16/4]|nr:hypothetical protein CIY_00890 [Butyrivibrio fibrisolvens 16/4]
MGSAELKRQKASKEELRNKYSNRKNAVDNIMRNIDGIVYSFPGTINREIVYLYDSFKSGLKGQTTSLISDIEGTMQDSTDTDSRISNANSNLNSESLHCQSRIDTLNSEIESLNSQIAAAEAAEAEEARRAAEAAAAANRRV